MTREETLAFFKRREEFWRLRDTPALAAAHAEHGVVVSPLFGTVRGRAAIEETYRNLFATFSNVHQTWEEPIIDGPRVVQLFKSSATHTRDIFGAPATGRRFEIQGVFVYTFEGDKIAHEWRIYDFTSLLIQIGVLKAKPGI